MNSATKGVNEVGGIAGEASRHSSYAGDLGQKRKHFSGVDLKEMVALFSASPHQKLRQFAAARAQIDDDLMPRIQMREFGRDVLENESVLASAVGVGKAHLLVNAQCRIDRPRRRNDSYVTSSNWRKSIGASWHASPSRLR